MKSTNRSLIAFFDTEFTDLITNPRLLSVGIVCVDGHGVEREFYAEVTDVERIKGASEFVKENVLTQFGLLPGAACTYAELCIRLVEFLHQLLDSRQDGETIELAHDYAGDWKRFERAIKDAGLNTGDSVWAFLRPVNVINIVDTIEGVDAAEVYFESQWLEPITRHHALCDARALRIAYGAARSKA